MKLRHGGAGRGQGRKYILPTDEEVWAVFNIAARVDRWLLARQQERSSKAYFAKFESLPALRADWLQIRRYWKQPHRDRIIDAIEKSQTSQLPKVRAAAAKVLDDPSEGVSWNDVSTNASALRGVHSPPQLLNHRRQKLMFKLAAHMATKKLQKAVSPTTVREVWRKMNSAARD